MPVISLCMIVKNEEIMLPGCLQSVHNCVDEIIVVDTGSTDRTVEIAEHYGAKVYHHPWEDDFSLHRNQSLSYASGNWILIMDADEVMAKEQQAKIRSILSQAHPDLTQVYCIIRDIKNNSSSMVSSSLRLFRNGVGAYYKGIIHNLITVPTGEEMKSDITLFHYGYGLSPDVMAKKYKRTYLLLKKQLHEKPDDLYALYNMATTLSNIDPAKSVEYGFKLISLLMKKESVPIFYINLFYIMAGNFFKLKKNDQGIYMCLEAIKLCPEYVDAYWILCEAYFEKKDYQSVITYGNKFFHYLDYYKRHQNELSDLFVYSFDKEDQVRLRLGLSYVYKGNWVSAKLNIRAYIADQNSASDAAGVILNHLKSHHKDFENVRPKVMSLLYQ